MKAIIKIQLNVKKKKKLFHVILSLSESADFL